MPWTSLVSRITRSLDEYDPCSVIHGSDPVLNAPPVAWVPLAGIQGLLVYGSTGSSDRLPLSWDGGTDGWTGMGHTSTAHCGGWREDNGWQLGGGSAAGGRLDKNCPHWSGKGGRKRAWEWRSRWAAGSLEGCANVATLQGLRGAVVVHHAAGGLSVPREHQAAELLHLNTERQSRNKEEGKNEWKTKTVK